MNVNISGTAIPKDAIVEIKNIQQIAIIIGIEIKPVILPNNPKILPGFIFPIILLNNPPKNLPDIILPKNL